MTEETWKAIVGYEGFYEVSNLGNVRSLDRVVSSSYNTCPDQHHKGQDLKPFWGTNGPNSKGSIKVELCGPIVRRCCKGVAAIVAAAFLGPRPDGYVTFIVDRDYENVGLDNLIYIPKGLLIRLNSSSETARDNGERDLEKYVSGELV